MKRITINFEDDIYFKIQKRSQAEGLSISKHINNILKLLYEEDKLNSTFEELSRCISSIDNKLSFLTKKQKLHFTLSQQHFVNQGYLDNLEIKKDKCWRKIEEDFLDDKFNS